MANPTRQDVWKHFGAPTDQLGSANDPRTTEEHGVCWNEKWIYRENGGEGVDRVVLWNRYDLLGIFRVSPDGEATPESLPE